MACRQLNYPCISGEENKSQYLYLCYLKVTEGQVSLSTLYGTLRVSVNSLFFEYFDGLENPRFKSCERIYTIDFSLSLEIKSLVSYRWRNFNFFIRFRSVELSVKFYQNLWVGSPFILEN